MTRLGNTDEVAEDEREPQPEGEVVRVAVERLVGRRREVGCGHQPKGGEPAARRQRNGSEKGPGRKREGKNGQIQEEDGVAP